MGWQFRKRIQIIPGVKVNISKGGISTTVGTRGASVTIGEKGTYLNTGIPGTGLYNRTKLSGQSKSAAESKAADESGNFSDDNVLGIATVVIIFVSLFFAYLIWNSTGSFFTEAFFSCLTALGLFMLGVYNYSRSNGKVTKATIREELENVDKAIEALDKYADNGEEEILKAYKYCLTHLNEIDELEKIIVSLEDNSKVDESIKAEKRKELARLVDDFESHQIDGDVFVTQNAEKIYKRFVEAFDDLSACSKCRWTDREVNEFKELSSAGRVYLKRGIFDYVKSNYAIPILKVKDTCLYFYPRFIIESKSTTSFKVIPWTDFSIKEKVFESYRTTEHDCPRDAEIIGRHYLFERKDGGPDLRYSNNLQYYHIRIGEIEIKGLPFSYFSNHTSNRNFVSRCMDYKQSVNSVNKKKTDTVSTIERKARKAPTPEPELQKSNDQDMIRKVNPFVENGTLKMKKDEIAKFQRAINRIGYFYDKYCHTDEFYGYIRPNIKDIEVYGPAMCMADMITCVEQLGFTASMRGPLGIPLFMASFRLLKHETLDLDLLYRVDSEIVDSLQSGAIDNCLMVREGASGLDLFFISTFFDDWKNDKKDKYLELMHDFATLVAEYGGEMTKKKKDFLDSILAHQGISPSKENDNPAEPEKLKSAYENISEEGRQNSIEQLSKLIGLETVKKDVQTLSNFIKIQQRRSEQGLKTSNISYHCVFTGNPGTGKTSVARIVAGVYRDLGVLKKGHLVETDRSGLVAEYVGQTAVKTNKIIDSALDGVLFIDEAYTFVQGDANDYGREAIATLLKRMEDDRNRLVVVLAGYSKPMEEFINANPGLQSRFNRYINFPDYSEEELYDIFCSMLESADYKLSQDANDEVRDFIHKAVEEKDDKFGNARFVRNMFEKAIENQANRLAQMDDISAIELSTIEEVDIPK